MTKVVGVRFKDTGKTYYFDPKGLEIKKGDLVVVETARGMECGVAQYAPKEVAENEVAAPLKPVLRIATARDKQILEENKEKEKRAYEVCLQKIEKHKLDMNLTEVEYAFDGSKILFYFTADGRVDFRELVKDLASTFHTRIELRQIGVRDEAKMLGGLGVCGRPFCCSTFLNDFHSVSIKMAKEQGLSLSPSKISGTCGRLMCCLKYEQNAYEDAQKRMPKQESFVQTPDGPGNVKAVDLLRETVKVSLDSAPETQKCYHNCEICVLRNGKGSREGIEIPTERPERYVEEKEEEFIAPVISRHFEAEEPAETPAPVRERPREEGGESKNRRRHRGGRRRSGGSGEGTPNTSAPAKKEAPKAPEGQSRQGGKPANRSQRPKQDRPRTERPKQDQRPKQDAAPAREKVINLENGEAVKRRRTSNLSPSCSSWKTTRSATFASCFLARIMSMMVRITSCTLSLPYTWS